MRPRVKMNAYLPWYATWGSYPEKDLHLFYILANNDNILPEIIGFFSPSKKTDLEFVQRFQEAIDELTTIITD